MDFTKEQMLDMYSELARSRVLGEMMKEYIASGKISGAIHPCLGQEAITSGIISAAKITGLKLYNTGTHRGQTLMAYKVGFSPFIGEILGRTSGANDGISGEYHLTNIENGLIPATGGLGGTWGILDGVAWALKQQGRLDEAVVLAPYGDGASSEGPTFEALNIAMLYKLPILFFIENNGWAMSTPVEKQWPLENLSSRAAGFGMDAVCVDGNDICAVTEAVINGLKKAQQCIPNMVEVKTVRWEAHFLGDPQEMYRDTSYLEHLDEIDPLLIHEKKLKDLGYADDAYIADVKAKMGKEIEDAFNYNLEQPLPTRESVLDYNRLYSNNAGGEI